MRQANRKGIFVLPVVFVLAAVMMIWALTRPDPARGEPKDSPAPEDNALTFPLIVSGEAPANLSAMQEQFNEYVEEKIGVSVRFVPVDVGTLKDFYLLQKSSSDNTDFICLMPAGTQLSEMVEAGLVLPLDGLLEEYGEGILHAAAEVLPTGQLRGVQYMIPEVKDVYTMGTSIEFNAALVNKYGFDITNVKTLTDIEPMLAVIAAQEPGVVPLTASVGITGYTQLLGGYDSLNNNLGVLDLMEDRSLTVVDWYETERFMALAQQMRDWYLKGYIAQDTVVAQISGYELISSGRAFCSINTIMPTGDQGTDLNNSTGVIEIQLTEQPQLLTSYYAGLEGVCISTSCQEPEKAMQLLELLYTDPYLVNLLEYGVEGEDYTVTPEGMADNGGSYFLMFGQPLNQTLRYVPVEAGAAYSAQCAAFSARNVVSPAFGFVFDSSPVAREVALCQAVVDEYFPVIDCGCVDPETEIPKFIAALKEAGIDTIVAEKQRQLDEWANFNLR